MNSLLIIFIFVYVVTILIFLVSPITGFNKLLQRDVDKDFNPRKIQDVGYYRVIIPGGAVTAGLITFFPSPTLGI